MLTFREWLDAQYWPGFPVNDLTDEEYYELEDIYNGQFDVEKEFEKEVNGNDA